MQRLGARRAGPCGEGARNSDNVPRRTPANRRSQSRNRRRPPPVRGYGIPASGMRRGRRIALGGRFPYPPCGTLGQAPRRPSPAPPSRARRRDPPEAPAMSWAFASRTARQEHGERRVNTSGAFPSPLAHIHRVSAYGGGKHPPDGRPRGARELRGPARHTKAQPLRGIRGSRVRPARRANTRVPPTAGMSPFAEAGHPPAPRPAVALITGRMPSRAEREVRARALAARHRRAGPPNGITRAAGAAAPAK